jgi:hypothetical protein
MAPFGKSISAIRAVDKRVPVDREKLEAFRKLSSSCNEREFS